MGHGIDGPTNSGQAYMIVKASRFAGTGGTPYSGPTCTQAGVAPGKTHWSKKEAQDDADKLNAINPVGFQVVEHHLQGYFDAYPGR
jgi:hypothetical protein